MSDFPEGYFYIRSRQNGKVIDVDGGYTKVRKHKNLSLMKLESRPIQFNNVDAIIKQNDTKILIWTPKHNEDRDNQLWYYQDGFIINKNSGKVLDVRGGAIKDNAPIIQYDRKLVVDAQNQMWGYKGRDGMIYLLSDPQMVLDIRGGLTEDGSKVILYHRKLALEHNLNQQWDLVAAGNVRAEREVLFESEDF